MQSTGSPLQRVKLGATSQLIWLVILLLAQWTTLGYGMSDEAISALRQETIDIFYHGYDNYMKHAFPEDELRPLTCGPLTRDRKNPAHIEVNDVLGNYSLTLIDSLSTLAIIASSPPPEKGGRNKVLEDFQDGIRSLVEYYGDGSNGPGGLGKRARGFDLDSKVQVFETVIRGVGGLLSAHLFAVGDLPIRGYIPKVQKKNGREGIVWRNGLVYDGQLLRLATDLAERLLPAFHTATGLPYPRVNLRHGVPFYANSPYNVDGEHGQCLKDQQDDNPEITETCSAGAGSLVLEFSTLSRLTGDPRFESAAKNAFWAVWQRRSSIGLLGSGIDAETGQWVSPYTGIGAGIDSFFEYSLKTHILLSGHPYDLGHAETDSPDAFLSAWEQARAGIKRHIYRGAQHIHPHYIQVDLYTGATRAFWIDSLSAYYQGLLTLAGELDEAIETHLLYTALWTRYSAMPERWSTATGNIEGGLGWWGGRPEFIESTWYLYRATRDPWYLHVGEMALRDIKRRCWTRCGWAGLQDVRTGEKSDRMESFFLGETAKYLFLLFDPNHPLNTMDAPYVFTTEGHPLIIPKRLRRPDFRSPSRAPEWQPAPGICSIPPAPVPFSISATAARNDIFHAASLARLHQIPSKDAPGSPLLEFTEDHPSISIPGMQSPSNYTYYPWTLPPELIPHNATSSKIATRMTFDLSFPNLPSTIQGLALQRVSEGILVNSMSGLRLGMIREPEAVISDGQIALDERFRIYAIANFALGRDEKVFMSRETIESFNPVDPFFTRTRDPQHVDLLFDIEIPPSPLATGGTLSDLLASTIRSEEDDTNISNKKVIDTLELEIDQEELANDPSYFDAFLSSLQAFLSATAAPTSASLLSTPKVDRHHVPGTLPTGPGAAPLPDVSDPPLTYSDSKPLQWSTIYVHSTPLCEDQLPVEVVRQFQVVVIQRGGCSFSSKLQNIPSFAPKKSSLQLVVIVSYPEHEMPEWDYAKDGQDDQPKVDKNTDFGFGGRRINPLVQPLLDEMQHTPSGLPRHNPIPLIMVGGGEDTMDMLRKAKQVGVRRRYWFMSQGVRIGNLVIL
ncbi:seven-hairpin glycosidase [Delitschia confertaspora ATCC 74209]|uniref:alpha-1,2-Mannosidase n=1 Tax=Delitschia confertaspora ATCC 74209 TaxID=1513339 RepID=A0A9P4JKB6_9PLEO|nr:seven-hairpin glycosidase [Delitschia confertaspora ATCC 74209]